MKKSIIGLLFLLLINFTSAQTNFNSFISYVNGISDSLQKSAVLDSFISFHRNIRIPIAEDSWAVFLYKGNVNSVSIAGDFTNWTANLSLSKLPNSNFFYYKKIFENNARLDYKLVLNGSTWILDPYNPNRVSGGYGPNSELAMPDYIQPWEINFNQNIQHGNLITTSIASNNTGKTYQLQILVPASYNINPLKRYPTVYFQDGSEYVTLGSGVNVIDNLIAANKIDEVIGVFVKPTNRNDEYAGNLRMQYQSFFVNELVPLIDSLYRTIDSASQRLVLGDSFGGNISALISYNYPDVFGLCGLHSAAFWPNNYEVYNQILSGPIKNIRYASVWGTYESVYQNMRPFRDTLLNRGYDYHWSEFPEGHSWGLWRANIDFILEYFFPSSTSSVDENNDVITKDFELYQNYPNPFNPTTKIKFSIPNVVQDLSRNSKDDNLSSLTSLKIYDILGKKVATLISGELSPGIYEVEFNGKELSGGIYFYQIRVGNFIETKKMVYLK
ncbi:MAG: alpha/beta hydrolase-fold protein [Ignavibacteria bacterium]|nr:alpha/beta hydrolase-fold protein [Ignavibacteria bacterium]